MIATTTPDFELPLPAPVPGWKPARLVRFARITPVTRQWLWPGRVAVGRLTFLVGERGLGKGAVAADIAARVSRGLAWADQAEVPAPQGNVIVVCSDEDQRGEMPLQLQAAGADLEKVVAIEYCVPDDDTLPQLKWDYKLAALHSALETMPDCKLVVIDPISTFLDGPNGRERGAMQMLVRTLTALAHKYRVAIVIVAHLDDVAAARSISRLLGSFGPSAIERNMWGIFLDPAEPKRRVMASLDGNFSEETECLSYQLGMPGSTQLIQWGESNRVAPRSLLGARGRFSMAVQEYQDKENFVTQRLREALADGPVARANLWRHVNVPDPQLYRAAKRLGVISEKTGFLHGWTWMLPEQFPKWQAEQIERQQQQALARQERKRKKREAARGERQVGRTEERLHQTQRSQQPGERRAEHAEPTCKEPMKNDFSAVQHRQAGLTSATGPLTPGDAVASEQSAKTGRMRIPIELPASLMNSMRDGEKLEKPYIHVAAGYENDPETLAEIEQLKREWIEMELDQQRAEELERIHGEEEAEPPD